MAVEEDPYAEPLTLILLFSEEHDSCEQPAWPQVRPYQRADLFNISETFYCNSLCQECSPSASPLMAIF